MRITLLAFGILRDHLASATGPLEIPAGSTVRDLLQRCRTLAPTSTAPWSSIAVAVNQEYVPATHRLAEGDEVALLPPVSGGTAKKSAPSNPKATAGIPVITVRRKRVRLTEDPIDPAAIAASLKRGEDGACVLFDGIVRNNSRGRRTLYLFYEAYPDMAYAQMERLAAQALADFPIRDLAIVHRLGRFEIGETSVVIAVASAHRAAAFDACRFLIDTLKKTVPIWKKEFFEDGAVWVQGDPFPTELKADGSKSPSVRRTAKSTKKSSAPTAKESKPRRRERPR
jgi:molybdopterin synthase catalytic subunit